MNFITIYAIIMTIMFLIVVCCFVYAYKKNHELYAYCKELSEENNELKENTSKLIKAFINDSDDFNKVVRNFIDHHYSNKEYKGDNNYEFE